MTADGSDASFSAPRFDVVLRGYDRRQVDEHVARLQRVLSRMRRDLDSARNMPQQVLTPSGVRPSPTPRSRAESRLGGEGPDVVGSFTDRMQTILQAAEEEAAEIRAKAQAERRADEEKVAGIRRSLVDLARQRDAVLAELTRVRGQLDGLLAAPTTRIVLPVQETAASVSSAEARMRDAGAGQPLPGTPEGAFDDASDVALPGQPDPEGREEETAPAWPGPREPEAERTMFLEPARVRPVAGAAEDEEAAVPDGGADGPGTAVLPAAERPDAPSGGGTLPGTPVPEGGAEEEQSPSVPSRSG
jgi:hypothetical protein